MIEMYFQDMFYWMAHLKDDMVWTHFTNDFSITIRIRWKFHLALIQ